MSSLTPNLHLVKPSLTDAVEQTIPALASNFDTIDSTILALQGVSPSNANPVMDGTAIPGTATTYARGDHVHPTDTSRAPLASPTFTGTPAAPTAAAATNTTQIATTAFVQAVVTALINGAPGALDTLKELADAMGDDPNFATTVTNSLALKAPIANPSFTGTVSLPGDPAAALQASTKQYVDNLPVLSVFRQTAHNGNFSVNQRQVSGTVTLAAGQYGHDRWKAGAGGCTYTFSTGINVTTITITSGTLVQAIESHQIYSGTYTLSWAGTAQGRINSGSYGASGVQASLTGGVSVTIEFNAGTVSKVQFNYGSQPLPFQARGFYDELALCQRYYEKSYDYTTPVGTASIVASIQAFVVASPIANNQPYGRVNYKVTKRAVPTVTIYPFTTTTNTGRVSDNNGVDLAASSGSVNYSGTNGFTVQNASGASLTASANTVLFHWEATADL